MFESPFLVTSVQAGDACSRTPLGLGHRELASPFLVAWGLGLHHLETEENPSPPTWKDLRLGLISHLWRSVTTG